MRGIDRRQFLRTTTASALTLGVARALPLVGAAGAGVTWPASAWAKTRWPPDKIEQSLHARIAEVLPILGHKKPKLSKELSEACRVWARVVIEGGLATRYDPEYKGREFVVAGTVAEAKLHSKFGRRPEQSVDALLAGFELAARFLDLRRWIPADGEGDNTVGIGFVKGKPGWAVVIRCESPENTHLGPLVREVTQLVDDKEITTRELRSCTWPVSNWPRPSEKAQQVARTIGQRLFFSALGPPGEGSKTGPGHPFSWYIPGLDPETVVSRLGVLYKLRARARHHRPRLSVGLINSYRIGGDLSDNQTMDSAEMNSFISKAYESPYRLLPQYSVHLAPSNQLGPGLYAARFALRLKGEAVPFIREVISEVGSSAFRKNVHYRG